ncbi:class I SAM-dependent methyltransferase [Acuticoccus sp.]|uniref:class I SAM-dependent methyltransferase n=1 Tax=Acuticoccus sp. TaxID=1904378 RepID=UPI003B52CB45
MTRQTGFKPAEIAEAQRMSAEEAIRYHYDNDTQFFALWLDPTLSYSCARWHDPLTEAPVAATLHDAQLEKLRHHLDAARVGEGTRVLDVGCGWGAILEAASRRGAAHALGLTLSEDQLAHIEAAGWPRTEARLEDAFAFTTEAPFDAAISIGAFEHFAKPHMSREEKVATYRAFFERLAAALTPGARFSLQTIVWEAVDFETSKTTLPEIIFPQSDIPFIEEIVMGSADAFRLIYLENDPKPYQLTLEAWLENFRAQREPIVAEWGEAKYAFFLDYLRYSRLAFTRRKNSLARMVFVRR